MKSTPILNSFVGGCLSPKLSGRSDIQQYFQSAEILTNILVEPYGGAKLAPGKFFCAEVKSSSKMTRLLSFKFSNQQAYIIEVGDYYMRFYKDDAQITSTGAPYEIVTPYAEDDIWEIQISGNADIAYLWHPRYAPRKLSRSGHTNWTLAEVDYSTGSSRAPLMDENVGSTTITPSAATGTVTLTASSAIFNSGHVGSIWKVNTGYVKITAYTSSTVVTGTVLYSGTIGGTSAYTAWSEAAWSAYRGYPSCGTFYEQRLMAASTTSQPQTVWGSQNRAYENFEVGTDDSDGLAYTLATEQVAVILWLFPSDSLVAGTTSGIFTINGGSSNDALTPTNVRVKKQTTYNAESWIQPQGIGSYMYYVQEFARKMMEFAYSIDYDKYVSNDSTILSEHITESGIIDMAYQQNPDGILWCVLNNGKLATFTRQIEQKVNAWTQQETDGYYESVAVIPKPDKGYDQVWFIVRRTINGVTKRYVEYLANPRWVNDLDDEEQEYAFFVDSGLMYDNPKTVTGATQANPVVVTAAAHGFSNGDIVKLRGVQGMTQLNNRKFMIANVATNTFQLQTTAGVNIDGTGYDAYTSGGTVRECVSSVTGLNHLEGKTVKVVVDGAAHPDCVVASGAIALNDAYGQVIAGLFTPAQIRTNDLEGASQQGTSQAKTKRVTKVAVRFYKSLGCKVGYGANMDTIPFRTTAMPTDQAVELYTGDKEIAFPKGWAKQVKIDIVQDQPLPFQVLAVIPFMDTND